MLIAEDLLLLLTDDATGKAVVDGQRLDLALAGSVLVELVIARRAEVRTVQGRFSSRAVVVPVTGPPTGDPVLDEALRRLAAGAPRTPQSALGPLGKGLKDVLRDRLVARGILRAEHGTVLGIFPTRAWPAVDSSHEAAVRAGLRDVLLTGRPPSDREASLVAVLHALDVVPKQFGDLGLDRRTLKARAGAIARHHVAGDAVRKAIEAVNAATMAAVTAAGAAAAASS
ncbi:GPP34 family phosphoprotein [Actinotalea sp. AC32]|nr:GPP34 family phosphoprotein [Actinotalea sp. AC32]